MDDTEHFNPKALSPSMTELRTFEDFKGADERHQSSSIPLVVDLDGSLIKTDLLHESFFSSVMNGFEHHWSTLNALRRGKAPLKAYLAGAGTIDYALLPFNSDVL